MLPTITGTDAHDDAVRLLAVAQRAEAGGFDGVYVGDHLVHPRPLLESVVTLTTVAAATDSVAVGFCVLLVALRATVVLAKELATLAVFAPGRLRVGIGVGGEYPDEFAIGGVRLEDRGTRTEAAVRQLRSLVAGRPTTVAGVNGDEVEATLAPPAPGKVPFVFGGWSAASLRRAARLGDGWIGYLLAPESFSRRRSLLLDHRAEYAVGVDAVHDRDAASRVTRRDREGCAGARREHLGDDHRQRSDLPGAPVRCRPGRRDRRAAPRILGTGLHRLRPEPR